jgi:hypothetical protein
VIRKAIERAALSSPLTAQIDAGVRQLETELARAHRANAALQREVSELRRENARLRQDNFMEEAA